MKTMCGERGSHKVVASTVFVQFWELQHAQKTLGHMYNYALHDDSKYDWNNKNVINMHGEILALAPPRIPSHTFT